MQTPIKVNLTIIDRLYDSVNAGLVPRSTGTSISWEINRDYLDTAKSKFIPEKQMYCQVGDILVARSESLKIEGKHTVTPWVGTEIRPLYIGLVESIEESNNSDQPVINTRDIQSIMNYSFPATRGTGSNVQNHLRTLFTKYFKSNYFLTGTGFILDAAKSDEVPIPWSYQPSDPPTSTNLVSYFVNAFKKYNVVFDMSYIDATPKFIQIESGTGETSSHTVYSVNIHMAVGRSTKSALNIKNNVNDFANWSVYYTPSYQDTPNFISVYDKATFTDMETSNPVKSYIIRPDGTITDSFLGSSGVRLPVKPTIGFIDSSEENPQTPLEVAQSELSVSTYTHEISFDLNLDSKLISFDDLEFGRLANIFYGSDLYASILTGYSLSSKSTWINLKFGNVRSTLQSLLDSL